MTAALGKVVIVAQARMSSTRLPGKVLADLDGSPVVDHVVRRAARVPEADEVVVAITTDASDDVLAEHLERLGVATVRGSLDDVLGRYLLAARESDADAVVRITCDCPLIDPTVVSEVIQAYSTAPRPDYCSDIIERAYPIGMDCEIVSREALERAGRDAVAPEEREHVTLHIYRRPDAFRLRSVVAPTWARHPEWRLTVDEQADLDVVRGLVRLLGADATLAEIVEAVERDPSLLDANRGVRHRHMSRKAED